MRVSNVLLLLLFNIPIFATTWNSPSTLTSAQGITDIQIAINDEGRGMAVWIEDSTIRAAALSSGTWHTPVDLTDGQNHVERPQVAINASGMAVVVWTELVSSDYLIIAAIYKGSWGSNAVVSDFGEAFDPQVSINASGHALAVWQQSDTDAIKASFYNCSWKSPTTISAFKGVHGADVALSESDLGLAVWVGNDGSHFVIETATLNGSWQSPKSLSGMGAEANNCSVVMNKEGQGAAIWERESVNGNVIQTVFYDDGWRKIADLSDDSDDAFFGEIALNDSGHAIASWSYYNGTTYQIKSSFYLSSWSAPELISNAGDDVIVSQIALNNSDEAVATWEANTTGSQNLIKAATFVYPTWGLPETLSNPRLPSYRPVVGLSHNHRAHISWWSFDDPENLVQVASTNLFSTKR